MFWFLLVIGIGTLIALFMKKSLKTNHKKRIKHSEIKEEWPFVKVKLMSIPEQQLYWKLVKLLPENIVLAQVQASRTIRVKKGHDFKYWFNRINRTSYDFVVCNKYSYPLAVIELDDSSHNTEKRQQDDKRKDNALEGADLKIIRWTVNQIPDDETIKTLFQADI